MEVTSVIARVEHVRAAELQPRMVRPVFERAGIDWPEFLECGVEVSRLLKAGDPISIKVARAAVMANRPVGEGDDLRVYHRHIRAANICMKGSRDFFRDNNLSWPEFLDKGIAVAVLEEIGNPIALRAAAQAIAEEAVNGR